MSVFQRQSSVICSCIKNSKDFDGGGPKSHLDLRMSEGMCICFSGVWGKLIGDN